MMSGDGRSWQPAQMRRRTSPWCVPVHVEYAMTWSFSACVSRIVQSRSGKAANNPNEHVGETCPADSRYRGRVCP